MLNSVPIRPSASISFNTSIRLVLNPLSSKIRDTKQDLKSGVALIKVESHFFVTPVFLSLKTKLRNFIY